MLVSNQMKVLDNFLILIHGVLYIYILLINMITERLGQRSVNGEKHCVYVWMSYELNKEEVLSQIR